MLITRRVVGRALPVCVFLLLWTVLWADRTHEDLHPKQAAHETGLWVEALGPLVKWLSSERPSLRSFPSETAQQLLRSS